MTRRTHRRLLTGVPALAVALSLTPYGAGPASGNEERDRTGRASESATTSVVQQQRPLPLLRPNLRPVRPRNLYIEMRDGVRWLRFEGTLGNIGRGPLETRPDSRRDCPAGQRHASQVIYRDVDGNGRFKRSIDTRRWVRSAGCMVFHPRHHHWHFDAASRYSLTPASASRVVSKHRKTSFCLRDSRRVPPPWGASKAYGAHYGYCDQNNPQGISIGWADVYQSFLPGQALRLPNRMPNGRYCLRVRVDPRDQLVETDETDNMSFRAIRIRERKVVPIDLHFCR